MDVSIVIVNWNTCAILRQCLTSIYQETRDIVFEIIVVDNGSADGSVEMVKSEYPSVILIENSNNLGFAAANNQGVKIAKGEYLLLLNSDTIILDSAIQRSFNFALRHPETCVIGCRVLNPDHTLQPTCFMYPSPLNLFLSATYLYKLFPENRFFGRERMTWWKRDTIEEVEVVTGCYMLIKHSTMEAVNGFDESYFMYGEESDLCYRVASRGGKLLFTPDVEIIHLGGASSSQMRPEMIMQTRAAILYFIKKHRSISAYYLSCLLLSLHAAVRIPVWCLKLLFSENRSHCRMRIRVYSLASVYTLMGWKALVFRKK